jgi:hypothetical protein
MNASIARQRDGMMTRMATKARQQSQRQQNSNNSHSNTIPPLARAIALPLALPPAPAPPPRKVDDHDHGGGSDSCSCRPSDTMATTIIMPILLDSDSSSVRSEFCDEHDDDDMEEPSSQQTQLGSHQSHQHHQQQHQSSSTSTSWVPLSQRGGLLHEYYYTATTGTTAGAAVAGSHHRRPRSPKQGHICLGCICDVRRAVLFVNIATGVSAAIGTVGFGIFWIRDVTAVEFTDDLYLEGPYEETKPLILNAFVVTALAAVFNIGAIVGAGMYRAWLVALNAAYVLVATVSLVTTMYVTAQRDPEYDFSWLTCMAILAIGMLLFYPNVILCYEMQTGVMTQKTYHRREEMSCCCTRSSR